VLAATSTPDSSFRLANVFNPGKCTLKLFQKRGSGRFANHDGDYNPLKIPAAWGVVRFGRALVVNFTIAAYGYAKHGSYHKSARVTYPTLRFFS
jgi:hypothetical protein